MLTPEGELDVTISQELDVQLTSARGDHRHLVLDLSAVTFIDTSVIAVIVRNWKALTATGGTLALAGPRYRKTKTVWLTGLAERLPFTTPSPRPPPPRRPAPPSGKQPTPG